MWCTPNRSRAPTLSPEANLSPEATLSSELILSDPELTLNTEATLSSAANLSSEANHSPETRRTCACNPHRVPRLSSVNNRNNFKRRDKARHGLIRHLGRRHRHHPRGRWHRLRHRRRRRRRHHRHPDRSARWTVIAVNHDAGAHRFTTEVDGSVAELDYTLADAVMTITHTGVPPAIGGRGIAAKLMEAALNAARTAGWSVIPACSYAQSYLEKQPQAPDKKHIDALLDEALEESFPASDPPSVGASS